MQIPAEAPPSFPVFNSLLVCQQSAVFSRRITVIKAAVKKQQRKYVIEASLRRTLCPVNFTLRAAADLSPAQAAVLAAVSAQVAEIQTGLRAFTSTFQLSTSVGGPGGLWPCRRPHAAAQLFHQKLPFSLFRIEIVPGSSNKVVFFRDLLRLNLESVALRKKMDVKWELPWVRRHLAARADGGPLLRSQQRSVKASGSDLFLVRLLCLAPLKLPVHAAERG